MKLFISTIVASLFIFCSIRAQDISYPPTEYIADDGTIYWNIDLPLYIRVSPYPDGQGTLLESKNPKYSNPMFLDTEGTNYIRTRYAVDKDSKKVVDPLREVLMPIVADGSGPESSIYFLDAESSYSNKTRYYGPNLSVNISAVDKISGLDLLKYSINNSGYSDFFEPIRFSNEGSQTILYYGVDKVGNKEDTHSREFIVDLTPPVVTHNINGLADANIIAATSKIYFTASDELSGLDKIMYRFDDQGFKLYNGSNVKFAHLSDGDHILEYYAVDKVGNQTGTFTVELYFDKTAPLTASDILGDRFIVNDRVYFSGRTKMKLTAVDNKVGVKDIMYSIDRKEFQVYDQPFYLPSIIGEHSIRYYSSDRLSNRPTGSETYKHNISLVYLDLTGPDISYRLRGPSFQTAGVQYISPKTLIQISGRDSGSGLQYLTYSIDGAAAEQVYSEPFTINTSGEHNIELFGYDNVNNRNVSAMSVFVDAGVPNIFENYSTRAVSSEDGLQVYPKYMTLFLAATDDIVGSDKIYYRINGSKEILYTKPLSSFRSNATYTIAIRAIDMVGNESIREISFKIAGN